MSLVDVILNRRSIRRYKQTDIPKDVLYQILEAGRQAPSAANRQPWRFIVITDNELKRQLSHWRWNQFIKHSALTIAGCTYTDDDLALIDISIALQNMVIAAWALGVGSCWIAAFDQEKTKELLNVPEGWKIVALITFGYPAEQPQSRRKKPIEEIVTFNTF